MRSSKEIIITIPRRQATTRNMSTFTGYPNKAHWKLWGGGVPKANLKSLYREVLTYLEIREGGGRSRGKPETSFEREIKGNVTENIW